MARKEKVSLCLAPELLERLDSEAFRTRRSRSNMVEVILTEALKEEEKEPRSPGPIARSIR